MKVIAFCWKITALTRMAAAAVGGAGVPPPEVRPFEVVSDSIGFRQHADDCWSNTVQELFFFSDGLRELTQPLFYHLTDRDAALFVDDAIRRNIVIGGELLVTPPRTPPFHINRRDAFLRGVLAMRDRFQTHYDFIKKEIDVERKRQLSENLSLVAANVFKTDEEKRSLACSEKVGGVGSRNYIVLFSHLLRTFFIQYDVVDIRAHLNSPTSGSNPSFAYLLGLYIMRENTAIQRAPKHLVGLLRNGGNWYFYDSNHGVLPLVKKIVDHWIECFRTNTPTAIRVITDRDKGVKSCHIFKMTDMTLFNSEDAGQIKVVPVLPAGGAIPSHILTVDGWKTFEEVQAMGIHKSIPFSLYVDEKYAWADLRRWYRNIVYPVVYHICVTKKGPDPPTWPPVPPRPMPPRAPPLRPAVAAPPLPKVPGFVPTKKQRHRQRQRKTRRARR